MGYLGRFQFSNSYLNRVSAMDCPKHLGLCYITPTEILNAKRLTTTAGLTGVGISELETTADHRVAVI
jgi:hypothetical protein